MRALKHNISGYTVQDAANLVDLSVPRVRQVIKEYDIDVEYVGRTIIITEKGIKQIRERNTKPGPPPVKANGRAHR